MSSNDEEAKSKRAQILKRVEARRKQREQEESPMKVAAAFEKRREKEESARKELELALTAAETKLIKMEQQTQTVISEKQTELENYKHSSESQIKQLNETIEQLQKQLKSLQQQSVDAPQTSTVSQSEFTDLNNRYQDLLQKSEIQERRINDYRDQVATLELKLQTHLQDHVITVQSMQQRFDTLSQEKQALDQLITTLNEEVEAQEFLCEQTQEDFDNLTLLLREKDEEVFELQEKVVQLELDKEELTLMLEEGNFNSISLAELPTPRGSSTNSPVPQSASTRNTTNSTKDFVTQLVEEFNLLRSDPAAYAENHLTPLLNRFDGLKYVIPELNYSFTTKEGKKAVEEAIKYLSTLTPLGKLTMKSGLNQSCQDLCDQNGPKGLTDDTCADGTTSSVRLAKYGKWRGRIMELTSYGARSNDPQEVITQWLIDDGNLERSQRKTVLEPEFSVIGVGSSPHKRLEYMAVVALATSYGDSTSSNNSANDLKETSDGNYIIVSEPCRVPKSNIQLFLQEKTITLEVKTEDGELTHQWRLPFGVSPTLIKASYNEATEVEILIPKAGSNVVSGEQVIGVFSLPADSNVQVNRLDLEIDQKRDAITFQTSACSVDVDVHLKIHDSIQLCFESVYTEKFVNDAGSNTTKSITRKETISLPFSIELSQVTTNLENGQLTVTVNKPQPCADKTPIPVS